MLRRSLQVPETMGNSAMCAGFAGMWVVHKAQRVAVTAFGARILYCAILIVRLVVVRLPLNSLALTSPLWPRRLKGRGGADSGQHGL